VADLKHYQDAAGHVFSMTESDAKLLAYAPADIGKVKAANKAADDAREAARLSDRDRELNAREAALVEREKAVEQAQTEANKRK
jgi:hypothetical protein